jgi:hypothetical protein
MFLLRVKYLFTSYGLKLLFFASSVLLLFIDVICAMGKDKDSTSVYFSI